MSRKLITAILLLPAMVCLSAGLHAGHAASRSQTLQIAGSTTVLPVVSRAAERFRKIHPEVTITVNSGGSGVGINAVGGGRVDIGLISRDLTEREKSRYQNASLKIHVIGYDGVACVVSSEIFHSGVKALSREQIAAVYLGKIINWQEVGGADRPIVVVDKELHRGTRHVFMKYILGNERARAPAARLVTGSNNEEQAKIAQSDAAIGMLSRAWINDDVVGIGIRQGDEIIRPTLANIRSGRYPMVRNLAMVTAGKPSGLAKEFIEFVLGPEGQKIVEASGYVPVR